MTESVIEKYCIDCRHCTPRYDQRHQCRHPLTVEHDVVTGLPLFRSCEYVRITSGKCKLSGELWESRKPLITTLLDAFAKFYSKKVLKID
jgi:hypothetical protein